MKDPNVVEIVLKCESYLVPINNQWDGQFTSFIKQTMKEKNKNLTIPFRMQISTFTLPTKPSGAIMIGIGSGVAPFMGMIEHKQLAKEGSSADIFNEMNLIFGIRNKNEDYIEQQFFEEAVDKKTLESLNIVESRAGKARYYVQDFIRDNTELIANGILEDGAAIYICG